MRQETELLRGIDGKRVTAVVTEILQRHVDDYQNTWQSVLRLYRQEDKFWNWAFKKRVFLSRDNYEGYAIEYNGRTQGLIMLETQWHRSQVAVGEPLVYVMSIASAPWNRRLRGRSPEFRTVGTTLLKFAQQRSLDLGYGGRLGLHSLPGAIGFYESKNMMRFDPDPDDYVDDDESLTYFEYPLDLGE
jgi:hypothetical protein